MAASLNAIHEGELYDDGEEEERKRPRRTSALMQRFEQSIIGRPTGSGPAPLVTMTVSFDVIIKYRFSSSKRLLTLDLENMKIVQQTGKTQTKQNLCSEVDCTSFEQPNGPNDGLLHFKLQSPSDKPGGAMYERTKAFQFTSPEDAISFMEYLNLAATCGMVLVECFNTFDRNTDKLIDAEDIMVAAVNNGVTPIEKTDADHMISLGDAARRGKMNFTSFFGIFLQDVPDFSGCFQSADLAASNKASKRWSQAVASTDPTAMIKCMLEHWFDVSSKAKLVDLSTQGSQTWGLGPGGGESNRSMLMQLQMSFKGQLPLVPNESVIKTMDRTRWRGESMGDKELLGTLRITNYRILFTRLMTPGQAAAGPDISPAFNVISIPFGTINRTELAEARSGRRQELIVFGKDLRLVRIAVEADNKFLQMVHELIRSLAFPTSLEHLFAFTYKPEYPDRWDVFDPAVEYERIGLIGDGNPNWQLYRQEFSDEVPVADCLAPTYPSAWVVPASLDDDQIRSAAKYRSKQRMPAACWMHPDTGAVMTRSSQPMAGVAAKSNADDIALLEAYRLAGRSHHQPQNLEGSGSNTGSQRLAMSTVKVNALQVTPRPFYIADCRGRVAATGNKLQGKGAENVSNYTATELYFCDILNIHTMRESQSALAAMLMPDADYSVSESMPPTAAAGDPSYLSAMEKTGWLRHVSLVLSASIWCAKKMTFEGASVLVHCSDGWDRTAQVCATSQMLMDPYYRTIEGFAVVIEKEWLTFGHKFQQRVAHGDPDFNNQERSPIFIQWLECVWNLTEQLPAAFEFDERLLMFLADHLYSCLFGNFIGNTDRDRWTELKVREKTTSVWSYVLHYSERFTNPMYETIGEPLWPKCAIRDLKLWERYYLRHNPDAHPSRYSGKVWVDDYGDSDVRGSFDDGESLERKSSVLSSPGSSRGLGVLEEEEAAEA
eukprot:CAMPEP_0182570900 /NCGR_PEP_ID=MMETSP1324-20130603/11070_1 /TAXON_ID=236786 /ORGANISM="Florenciella sp., Strain RCC1587" /LENGTH=944 /DNA_ID=CAMNT_0024785341 /DNA_START=247 /DNA_END=3078 /DNA_ORIENTATION=+